MSEGSMIRNDKQVFFNQLKGAIHEINEGEHFCNITLSVGHENVRHANFIVKTTFFDSHIRNKYTVYDKVCIQFYLVSRMKHGRWYTSANLLDIKMAD